MAGTPAAERTDTFYPFVLRTEPGARGCVLPALLHAVCLGAGASRVPGRGTRQRRAGCCHSGQAFDLPVRNRRCRERDGVARGPQHDGAGGKTRDAARRGRSPRRGCPVAAHMHGWTKAAPARPFPASALPIPPACAPEVDIRNPGAFYRKLDDWEAETFKQAKDCPTPLQAKRTTMLSLASLHHLLESAKELEKHDPAGELATLRLDIHNFKNASRNN